MGSIIMIRNIYSFWYIIIGLFLFTYSCGDNDSDDNRCHKNNPVNRHENNPENHHKNNQ